MTETALQASFTQESFDAFLEGRQEPDWLLDLRRDAWKAFNEFAWPNTTQEEWRRTDLRLFRLSEFGFPTPTEQAAELPTPVLSEGMELGGRGVTLNSMSVVSELSKKWAERGVIFDSLDRAVREHGDLIRPHLLSRAVDPKYDKFSALHAACWSGGTLLYVPEGVAIDEPIHTLSALRAGGVDLGHTLVILEAGAEATLLTETASDEEPGLHCGAVELLVGPGARLRYVSLQNWGSRVWHFAHQKAIVDKGAQLQWTVGALGSRLAKVNQHVSLVGSGAIVQVNGVMFTEGRQHLSYHTLQHHQAPGCESDLLYKTGLQGQSRSVWRGMIKVDPAAQQTNAYQRNDNLILSEDARADSIPGLEIEADDVRCTHGSTTGRVDDELVFYAQARGFTKNEAIRMIVNGFFQKVFDRITIESVRDALGEAIGRRIREYD